MSEYLNDLLDTLGRLPGLESYSRVIEAIRAKYDVDHVHYFAVSLGLLALSMLCFKSYQMYDG